MTSTQELAARLCRWSLDEWEREIRDDFPVLGHMTGNAASRVVAFCRTLDVTDRLRFGRAMPQQYFAEAYPRLAESVDERDRNLLRAYKALSTPSRGPTRPDKALRAELREELKSRLAFLGHYERGDGASDWRYVAERPEWRIITYIEAVGRFGDCSYFHVVDSTLYPKPEGALATRAGLQQFPFLILLQQFSYLRLLGISGMSKWRIAGREDALGAGRDIEMLCHWFFDRLPTLLGGLGAADGQEEGGGRPTTG